MHLKKVINCFLFLLYGLILIRGVSGYCSENGDKTEVILFYSPQCHACHQLKQEFFPGILEEYKDRILFKELNVYNPENLSLLISLSARFKQKGAATPAVLVGDSLLTGRHVIEKEFRNRLDKVIRDKIEPQFLFSQNAVLNKFKKFSFLTIIAAGLTDGVNPCAFAVIVFFISFLTVYGYSKEEVLCVGIFYLLAVFCSYLLIGLGLFSFLYSLREFYSLIKTFYVSVSVFCFGLFVISLFDYFRYKKTGSMKDITLRLPNFFKRRINLVIGRGLRQKKNFVKLATVSFFVGIVVSLLESVCTGQVYLPTIFFILKIPQLRVKAFFYLIVYNIMFIVPLMVIFILAFFGVSSKGFNEYFRKNMGKVKLITAFLFLILGVSILLII